MYKWRLYIDESGDHTYKHIDNLDTRYLGLTGVLILKEYYDNNVQHDLEALKRKFFKYDPDDPPILTRSEIIHRKRWFYVLQNKELNEEWEKEFLCFLDGLRQYTQIFTVVIDKKEHLQNYPVRTFDPYAYSLSVLLRRVRGFLKTRNAQADVIAESRGRVEDQQIMKAYIDIRNEGDYYGNAEEYTQAYPADKLLVKRKEINIAGLQLADVIAYGQKVQTILDNGSPFSRPLSRFTKELNCIVNNMVNQYGRYLLK